MSSLVILTEGPLLPHDVERLTALYGDADYTVHVCVPAREASGALDTAGDVADDVARTEFSKAVGELGDDETSPVHETDKATGYLESSLASLRAAGFGVEGELVPESPMSRVVEVAVQQSADTILVITQPHWLDEVLRRDWATRIVRQLKHDHQEIPVLHFIAGTDTVVS